MVLSLLIGGVSPLSGGCSWYRRAGWERLRRNGRFFSCAWASLFGELGKQQDGDQEWLTRSAIHSRPSSKAIIQAKSRPPQTMRSNQLNLAFVMRCPQRVQNTVGSRFQLPQCLQGIIVRPSTFIRSEARLV